MFAYDVCDGGVRQLSDRILRVDVPLPRVWVASPCQGEGRVRGHLRQLALKHQTPRLNPLPLPKGRGVTDASYRTVVASFFSSVGAKAPLPSSR
jgi:hypothetical protein